jgi:hypothetical protein
MMGASLHCYIPERWPDSFLQPSCGISGLTAFNLNISDSVFVVPTLYQALTEIYSPLY